MHELIPPALSAPLPLPTLGLTIRPATPDDIPFMDRLQKLHSKQVGWMPTKQFEGKIKAGHVLVAEERVEGEGVRREQDASSLTPHASTLNPSLVGYCIGNDQYFKRDDVGIIYQMNVLPGRQRGLIGATLLKAQFERSAYGCKLYCCWCAQDIAANKFWEAMGFVPLAFRAGSEKKSRVHIFWQKRIRQGDTTTPWWFPSQTSGGSIREDRIVLPIPPGTRWSDAKPLILPEGVNDRGEVGVNPPALPGDKKRHAGRKSGGLKPTLQKPLQKPERPAVSLGGLRFEPAPSEVPAKAEPKRGANAPAKPKQKNDPRLVAAARELRDRWLEQVNATPLLPQGKYEVFRPIDASVRIETEPMKLLEAA